MNMFRQVRQVRLNAPVVPPNLICSGLGVAHKCLKLLYGQRFSPFVEHPVTVGAYRAEISSGIDLIFASLPRDGPKMVNLNEFLSNLPVKRAKIEIAYHATVTVMVKAFLPSFSVSRVRRCGDLPAVALKIDRKLLIVFRRGVPG